MSKTAIRIEGLGKRYRLGGYHREESLRESLSRRFSLHSRRREVLVQRRNNPDHGQTQESFWALKNVELEISRGEAVGIIGLNGAGKTTLLKILSRITEPTSGRIEIRGRVGSLLEVGTGFHPELTGRENIYLNGAILGMTRLEIERKFDEIIAFAEIERFIDTPVKRYSSGMYIRLGFSVAAHLEPDIFLVDEVLSVGDISFQKKCLGKMDQISQQDRTVVFVSHNMASISSLTSKCVWLDHGQVRAVGDTKETVRRYVAAQTNVADAGGLVDLSGPKCRVHSRKAVAHDVMFQSIQLSNADGITTNVFIEGEPIKVTLTVRVFAAVNTVELYCQVMAIEGFVLFSCQTGKRFIRLEEGLYQVGFAIDPNVLQPGPYQLHLYVKSGVAQDLVGPAISIHVESFARPGEEFRDPNRAVGYVRMDYPWTKINRLAEPTGEGVPASG